MAVSDGASIGKEKTKLDESATAALTLSVLLGVTLLMICPFPDFHIRLHHIHLG